MKKFLLLFSLFLVGLVYAQPYTTTVSYLPNNPCANSPVYFSFTTNLTNPQFLYSYWDFGDGNNTGVWGSAGVQHTYTQAGIYQGLLILNDSFNVDTAFFTVFVGSDCSGMDYISGTVYIDANGNGQQDVGELGMPNQTVCIAAAAGPVYITTDSAGDYGYYNNGGPDTLTLLPPLYWNITDPTSGQHVVTLTGTGAIYGGNDFGITPVSNINDLRVYVNAGPPVPGFTRRYYINYYNDGTTVQSGTITFTYDPSLTYVGNSGTGTAGSGNVIFTTPSLLPGANGQFWVDLLADTANVSLGDTVKHYSVIDPVTGDTTPNNNLDTLCQEVVGSYDPNDKLVDAEAILPGQTLTYRVRFQNTGTYFATNVVIRDTLDANLDQSTFRILGSSHPMNYTLGNSAISFNFPNIMLPDSGRDEPGSHGFVTYSIRAKSDLVDGTHIYNTAHIYFDFNLPIVTNTTDNYIDLSSSTDQELHTLDIALYPNPMESYSWLTFDNPEQAAFSFRLLDLNGRVIQEELEIRSDKIRIDRNHLPAGVYLYQLQHENGAGVSGKLIMQ